MWFCFCLFRLFFLGGGVAWRVFWGYMVYRPRLRAVNRLGVISFSVTGWGYSIFCNPLPVWSVLTAFNG